MSSSRGSAQNNPPKPGRHYIKKADNAPTGIGKAIAKGLGPFEFDMHGHSVSTLERALLAFAQPAPGPDVHRYTFVLGETDAAAERDGKPARRRGA